MEHRLIGRSAEKGVWCVAGRFPTAELSDHGAVSWGAGSRPLGLEHLRIRAGKAGGALLLQVILRCQRDKSAGAVNLLFFVSVLPNLALCCLCRSP